MTQTNDLPKAEVESHTPGPWEVKRNGEFIWVESPVHTICLFYTLEPGVRRSMHAEANAALIASAPSLLSEVERLREALEKIADVTQPHLMVTQAEVNEIASAALSKGDR